MRASAKSHEDYTDGNKQFVPNSRFNQQSVKIFTGFNASFGVFRLFYDFNKMKPGLTVTPAIELIKTKGRKNEIWYQDLTNHFISSKNTFFPGRWKLEANLSYQYNDRKLMTTPESVDFTAVHMILQTTNWDLKGKYRLAADHDLTIGLYGMVQQNQNRDAPNHVLPDYHMNDLSFLVLYNGNINRKVFVQAGLRYEFRHIDVPGQEQHEEELKRNYGNISTSLGGTYKLSDDLLLRANLASAYRTPNIAELTEDGQHGTRYEQGNRDLKSQRNFEADLSMHYHRGIFMFDLATFFNYVNNYIYLSPTADTTDDGLQIFRYMQNDTKLYGFEGSGEILPVKWLHLRAGYSYLRAQMETGQNLPLIPQDKLNGRVMLEKESKHWYRKLSFWLDAGYAFAQNRPSLFETATPAYWLLNAGAGANLLFGRQTICLIPIK